METLTIRIPKGHRVADFNKDTGVVSFEPIPLNIRERLKTDEDILAYHGHTQESFDKWCEGIERHEKARRMHELMIAAYNEGKEPNWKDGTLKRWPWFNMPDPSGAGFSFFVDVSRRSVSAVGARLVFVGPESLDNLKDSVTKFLHIYEKSLTT